MPSASRIKAPDDRGVRNPLLSTHKPLSLPTQVSPPVSAILDGLREIDDDEAATHRQPLQAPEIATIASAAGFGIVVSSFLMFTPYWPRDPRPAKLAFLAVTIAVATPLVFLARALGVNFDSATTNRAIKACTYHSLCPGCGAPLRERTPEANGCVKCGQCKAAWRARRFGPPGRWVELADG